MSLPIVLLIAGMLLIYLGAEGLVWGGCQMAMFGMVKQPFTSCRYFSIMWTSGSKETHQNVRAGSDHMWVCSHHISAHLRP